jgi:RNA-directed DNA polymerase
MAETKSFSISKEAVWKAWLLVRANQGAAGVDDESIASFEKRLKPNLYKIWNRMSSGTYFPPPVRTVKIPKPDGRERTLGIPTVGDRVAQMVLNCTWSHWWNLASIGTPMGTDRRSPHSTRSA